MDCFDCNSSTSNVATDINSVLLSISEDLKAETMTNDVVCDENVCEKLSTNDFSADLENLEILQSCPENVFASNNTMMECLSDINSPDPFDLPPINNDDSILPIYGPFAEFEPPPAVKTDFLDMNATPGMCGFHNLGNTCFMNAGLQCLINNKNFKSYFVETDLNSIEKGFLSFKFAEIMKKAWSGSYSILHLGDFKECFGEKFAQFRNFRQHDCQEFLAMMLDIMHEELNSSNKSKVHSHTDSGVSSREVDSQSTSSQQAQKSDACDDTEDMEICDIKEGVEKTDSIDNALLKTSGPSTSNATFVTSDANNSKSITPTSKENIVVETNATLYERNTEKMADLLINNKKLDKIHNKNELDVLCNTEAQNRDSRLNTIEKNLVNESKVEKNELACKLNSVSKIPSIDDFVKVTKTWNTNVLVSEEKNNLIKFDSEKFPKLECNRLQETVDNLGQMVDMGLKQGGIKRVKITNVLNEKHKMLEKNSEQFSTGMTLHKRLKIENVDANLESPLTEQEEQVDMDQMPADEYSEGSSQSSELFTLNLDCQELLVAEEIRRAHNDWDEYKSFNQSVIVDTFHGQFRSSVICSECSHNSITYEPFMYLPVFLPHTLERQIVVTYVQNDGSTPIRFLVNVNKFDRILNVRQELLKLLDSASNEIVLAEVFENHISRILDENQSMRSINDLTRSVYAFEVGKNSELIAEPPKSSNGGSGDAGGALDLTDSEKSYKLNCKPSTVSTDCSVGSELEQQNCDSFLLPPLTADNELQLTCLPDMNPGGENSTYTSPTQYHTCAICLEELPNYRLSLHPSCECILCNSCIEVSCKHYGGEKFICPVCSAVVALEEDFVSLSEVGNYEFKIRTIPIPIVIRHDVFDDDGMLKEKKLIGHPGLLKLPSTFPASKIYDQVDKAIPFLSTYSLLLVDGQGTNCSRCLYNKHCSGCEITRIGEVKLQSGDNICVRYVDLTAEQIAATSSVVEDPSMQQTRHKSQLDIYDCLEYFSERENLDSPWYCPVCRQNQQATKSLSIWKFPEVLIIYLKRFVFHNFVSIKVEDKVSYPLEGLDMSSFSSAPLSEDLIYDLQSCVCHFGGVSAGHYTSYSKNAVTDEWCYYNDENFKKEAPKTDDCVNEYIFFYQRR